MGKVTFVGAGPGAADLITLRGWRALQEADVVLHDSLVDGSLLDGLSAELMFVGKRCGKHGVPQERTTELLVEQARAGRRVVRLKGGDPGVLARLGEEALRLAELGIEFEVVPGVTSVTAVPLHAGIPLTHRGIADSFTVLTAHRKEEDGPLSIPPYGPSRTLVLLMPVRTAPRWTAQLLEEGYPPDLPVAFVTAGATDLQRVLVTDVGSAAEAAAGAALGSPTLAVVGRVVELRESLQWFEPLLPRPEGKEGHEAA